MGWEALVVLFWNLPESLPHSQRPWLKSATPEGILEMPTPFSPGFPRHCASSEDHITLQHESCAQAAG